MRILISNDDGIHAPGIAALYDAVADPLGEFGGALGDAEVVWPIAPAEVESATSHGVTFDTPLMISDESVNERMAGIGVEGRPADCVKLAITSLWPERFGEGERPDLVLSGINSGANIGINVIYSGTVAAALEAAFLGVPSVALSLHIGPGRPDYKMAARHARRVLELIISGGVGAAGWLGPHTCLNVNIPLCEEGGPTPEEPEVVVCPMNTHPVNDAYERRESPAGQVYYWSTGTGLDFAGADAGTDVEQIMLRRITITPLHYDLTAGSQVDVWRERLAAKVCGTG